MNCKPRRRGRAHGSRRKLLLSWLCSGVALIVLVAVGCSSSPDAEAVDDAATIGGDADDAASIGQGEDPENPNAASEGTSDSGSSSTTQTEPAEEAVEELVIPEPQVLTSGGANGTTGNASVTIGSSTLTQWPVNNIRSGEPPDSSDRMRLVVEVDLHVLTGAGLPSGSRRLDFNLTDATGALQAPELMIDHVGASAALNLSTRGSSAIQLIFPVDESFDLSAAELVVVEPDRDRLPLLLPLDGPGYVESYPVLLASGQLGSFVNEPFLGCGTVVDIETVVERATIAVDAPTGAMARSNSGRRLLTVVLSMSNVSENPEGISVDALLCDEVSQWPRLELFVDGSAIESTREEWPRKISPGATSTVTTSYDIPASATDLQLGSAGEVLGQWQLDLPAVPGEDGASLARSTGASAPIELFQSSDNPGTVETNPVGDGGSVGSILGVEVTVGQSVSTSASPGSFVGDAATVDADGRTWVITTLTVDAEEQPPWEPALWNFALEDPTGRTYAAAQAFDAAGESVTSLTGSLGAPLTFVFETPGLVSVTDGWSVSFQRDESTPVALPLSGPASDTGEKFGQNGASEEIVIGDKAICSDGRMQATIIRTVFSLESERGSALYRSPMGQTLVRVTVGLQNLSPPDLGPAEIIVCGSLINWPEFLLRADGRPVQSFEGLTDNLDPGELGEYELTFEIPSDTQIIELWGGATPTLIDIWELKDAAEVLEDFDAQLVQPPADLESDEDQFTVITLDEEVLFAFGSATLQRDAIAPLNRVAQVLSTASEGDVFIVGHTDSIGDDASNQSLSEARARAVSDFLIDAGVDSGRVVATGAGESDPIAPNENDDGSDNPEGRAENRRVEILFTQIEN